jgi:hypothetical protein
MLVDRIELSPRDFQSPALPFKLYEQKTLGNFKVKNLTIFLLCAVIRPTQLGLRREVPP